MLETRQSGVLLSVTSLPSRYGIGDFGKGAYAFIDLLSKTGFSLWQILPLNPLGYGNSPYQPFSSYALDEQFIDLDDLVEKKFLKYVPSHKAKATVVEYDENRAFKMPYLQAAFKAQMKAEPNCLDAFVASHPWISDYAVFRMFKRRHPSSWNEWPEECREWIKTRPELSKKDQEAALFETWLQMTAYRQWDAIHAYANSKSIKIIGDIPFYVGFDSCDVWAHQDCFILDEETYNPTVVAGVPPDYFSATGQRWGNPIYNWKLLRENNFSFLEERIVNNSKIYDVIRLDHFRAFYNYWQVPCTCPTAIEGEWILAPGKEFFDLILNRHPEISIIAEDLGDMVPEVYELRDYFNFPGMNVIEFTFDDCEIHHKGDWNRVNSVCYIGTHDNDTIVSFFNLMPDWQKDAWTKALNNLGIEQGPIQDRMLRYCFGKPASWAIVSMQDILGEGAEARTNVPGVVDNRNWTYKLASFASFKAKMPELNLLLTKTGRHS